MITYGTKITNILNRLYLWKKDEDNPDSKVHGANMGPTWVLSAPDGPHVGPMNLAIRENKQCLKQFTNNSSNLSYYITKVWITYLFELIQLIWMKWKTVSQEMMPSVNLPPAFVQSTPGYIGLKRPVAQRTFKLSHFLHNFKTYWRIIFPFAYALMVHSQAMSKISWKYYNSLYGD